VTLFEEYENQVLKLKKRVVVDEMSLPLFFVLVLQLVGTNYRLFPTIFWEKAWERAFIPRVAQIRALCDKFIELIDEGKVENPTVTIINLLSDKGIDPVTLDVEESEKTVTLFSAEDAPLERTSRKV